MKWDENGNNVFFISVTAWSTLFCLIVAISLLVLKRSKNAPSRENSVFTGSPSQDLSSSSEREDAPGMASKNNESEGRYYNDIVLPCPIVPSRSSDRGPDSQTTAIKTRVSKKGNDREGNGWRCACEGGFLPPALLKSFGGAEAVLKMGTGQCYHNR
uniref:Uncharacterized protein n=1 Tax=Odontella aurita TaxID=265563 RepID=A0A7S4JXR9_9STRA|mmetsp:Transcript_56519/g.169060  ORF Transcript_56519/g.169060 Transcript_56519/m.169060 type:complete len:157 (+) Transcript_56519:309-779(+)